KAKAEGLEKEMAAMQGRAELAEVRLGEGSAADADRRRREANDRRAVYLRQQAEKERRAQNNIRSIKEVETDQPRFIDQKVTVEGDVTLATYYNYRYRQAQATHYSVMIKDQDGWLHAYIPKAKGEALRAVLLEKTTARGLFTITIPRARYEPAMSGGALADLVEYKLDE
ncbi:MAG: hypothetical protein WC069_07230, partial [Candidatus Shapirobacteria bacterium]